jgi:hypothetical protein
MRDIALNMDDDDDGEDDLERGADEVNEKGVMMKNI